jgi:membrane-bound inhibitor of C-type lysozyme
MRKATILVFAVLVAVLSCGCAGCPLKAGLGVQGGEPVIYQSGKGDRIVARYFSLSDKSLDFVKLALPGGKQYTLPCVLSASGARYTDERALVWWTKGDTAFAEVRDENGQWQRKYDCRQIPARK